MAEIKIEKKKPIWPWILFVLILLAIIAFFVYQNQADDDYNDDYNNEMTDDVNDTNYNDTITYDEATTYDVGSNAMTALMEAMKDSTRFGTDSTYTKMTLQSLAKLTAAKAKSHNVESTSAMTDLEQYTTTSETTDSRMPESTNMPLEFKEVSEDIVTLIDALHSKKGMNNDEAVAELKDTSKKISGTTSLAKQQRTIQTFFRQAHDVLHNIKS